MGSRISRFSRRGAGGVKLVKMALEGYWVEECKWLWRRGLMGITQGVVFIWHLRLGAVEAFYGEEEMRVCAREDFFGGMEVVVGMGVGRVFGSAEFLLAVVHRAHGGGGAGG